MRNGGAMAKKKMKIAIAAATAPISGRVSTREASDRFTCTGSPEDFDGGEGCVGWVVVGELMISDSVSEGADPRGPAAVRRS